MSISSFNLFRQISTMLSPKISSKTYIYAILSISLLRVSNIFIVEKLFIGILNLLISLSTLTVLSESVILDLLDLSPAKKTKEEFLLKELLPGGIGLLKFYLDLNLTQLQLISGVLAASYMKFQHKNHYLTEILPLIKSKRYVVSQDTQVNKT